jgi:NADH:ubiquinone oxidoreductase subunit H
MPFAQNIVISDVSSGILVIFAIPSLGVYGIIMSG